MKVRGTYLDIAKAFNCANHDILLSKLEYYGFRDNILMWFESYSKDRKQYVSVRQVKSRNVWNRMGCTSGSHFGADTIDFIPN